MDIDRAADILAAIVDRPVIAAAYVPEGNCLLLAFPEGKNVYISGDNLIIDMEAAN